jgi:hypothetical protein
MKPKSRGGSHGTWNSEKMLNGVEIAQQTSNLAAGRKK